VDVQPDYSRDTKAIYRDFFQAHSDIHDGLNIFELCYTARRPTWVPDMDAAPPHDWFIRTNSSGRSRGTLVQLSDDRARVWGVFCGILRREFKSVPLGSTNHTLKATALEWAAEYMAENPSLGADAAWTDLSIVLTGGWVYEVQRWEGVNLRASEIRGIVENWQSETQSETPSIGGVIEGTLQGKQSERLLNLMGDVMPGRSCYVSENGRTVLGPAMAQLGDHIYSILGCNCLMILRPAEDSTFEVVGPGLHPGYMNAEAQLGELPRGWVISAGHSDGQTRFLDETTGTETLDDPRMGALSPRWSRGATDDGILYWESAECRRRSDPRMDPSALRERGVPLEILTLV